MNATPEEWRPIPGHEGYDVSDQGRVRVRSFRGSSPRLIAPGNVKGYRQVALTSGKRAYVHCLIMEAFVGPRPEGMQVAHGNGKPSDNRRENLRYATPTENQADRILHGTYMDRERHPQARLTSSQVDEIRSEYALGAGSYAALGLRFGVSKTEIGQIVRGERWK